MKFSRVRTFRNYEAREVEALFQDVNCSYLTSIPAKTW